MSEGPIFRKTKATVPPRRDVRNEADAGNEEAEAFRNTADEKSPRGDKPFEKATVHTGMLKRHYIEPKKLYRS